ncbi:hypothetical protein PV04_04837 [Phialophora macrospora]|uniref:Uncharacterized protein n=1 Tax=Phialophora macrospora TaxID=1851006 RepID=A0A0D2FQU6_9EURO|nr:hypothetical protein PV04_04837 [Phialophora macrospora]
MSIYGPLRGLEYAFDYIDNCSRESVVDYVCPDKYRAWNFNPCRPGGHGSIEFRRAPGAVQSGSSIHWIAFTMAFIDMAIQYSPATLATRVRDAAYLPEVYHPDFRTELLECAAQLGLTGLLDLEAGRHEDPESLHFTTTSSKVINHLKRFDRRYRFSDNA